METIVCKKKAHLSKAEAIFFQERSGPMFFRTYECPNCGLFHVSTQPLNVNSHVSILFAIRKKEPTAVYVGPVSEEIDLYRVFYRDSYYLVHWFIRERTIRVLKEILWEDLTNGEG